MLDKLSLGLSPTARALLAGERSQVEDASLKARALERAQATLEGERWSGIKLRPADIALGSGRRSRTLRSALLIAAAVTVAGLATAGARLATRAFAPSRIVAATKPLPLPERAHAAAPAAAAAPASAPTFQLESGAEQPPSAAPPAGIPVAGTHAHPSTAGQYGLEVALLAPARTSLARGDFGGALSALAQHQRDYPHGQLAQERDALRVRALWGAGQKQAAEMAAAAFRRRYPRSGLLGWMKGRESDPDRWKGREGDPDRLKAPPAP
jgi:hypothetical protein